MTTTTKLSLKSFSDPELKRRLALEEDAAARQRVREEEAFQAPPPPPTRPKDDGVYGTGLPYKQGGRPNETWVPFGKNQLKLIHDTRPNRPRTLLRIELWDENGAVKKASFYRR